jgi:pyridoxine 4-dehydrogenase
VVNELIREALHPYADELVLVSKVGAARGGKGEIFAADHPDELRRGIEHNLWSLGVDRLGVVNLRLMRESAPNTFFDDQLQAMVSAREDGLIGAVGLSNVSLAHLQHAVRLVEVACVRTNSIPSTASPNPCSRSADAKASPSCPSLLLVLAQRLFWDIPCWQGSRRDWGALPRRRASRWELAIAPNLLLIPGTSSRQHLHENLAPSQVHLDDDALQAISQLSR